MFHPSPITAAVISLPVITHSCSPSQFPIPVPRFPSPFPFPIPVPRTRSPFLVPVLFQVPIRLKVSPFLSINYNINHVSAPSIFFFDLDSRKSTGFARRCITTYNNYTEAFARNSNLQHNSIGKLDILSESCFIRFQSFANSYLPTRDASMNILGECVYVSYINQILSFKKIA